MNGSELGSNCIKAIRDQLVPRYGGYLTVQGSLSQRQAGAFIVVDGRATYRDGNGRTGDIEFHCTMHPNGNVADAKYNSTTSLVEPSKTLRNAASLAYPSTP